MLNRFPGLNRRFFAGLFSGLFLTLVLGGLLGFVVSPSILTHRSSFPFEEEIGDSRVRAAIPENDKNKSNPVPVSPVSLAAGKSLYTGNCAFCHGVTGKGEAAIGKNLFPPAANLTEDKTRNKTDGELHWILQYGLSFVGMPAWKNSLNDDQLWQLVNYMRALQNGTANQTTSSAQTTPVSAANQGKAVSGTTTPYVAGTSGPTTTQASLSPSVIAGNSDLPGNVEAGRAVFAGVGCNACHGKEGEGDFGPKIAATKLSFVEFKNQIRMPKGKSMPPFPTEQVSDSQIVDIYAFLQSLK